MKYTVKVTTKSTYEEEWTYQIEANSKEEAYEKAKNRELLVGDLHDQFLLDEVITNMSIEDKYD